MWCGICLGLVDARDAARRGLMTKEGGIQSLAHYFHEIGSPPGRDEGDGAPTKQRRKS